MQEKRCGTCSNYNKKKRICKITKKFVMKIADACNNWGGKKNEQ